MKIVIRAYIYKEFTKDFVQKCTLVFEKHPKIKLLFYSKEEYWKIPQNDQIVLVYAVLKAIPLSEWKEMFKEVVGVEAVDDLKKHNCMGAYPLIQESEQNHSLYWVDIDMPPECYVR